MDAAGQRLSVVGEFRACPLAQHRSGWMQPACVAIGTHLSIAAEPPGN